jgi:hypothetical protein
LTLKFVAANVDKSVEVMQHTTLKTKYLLYWAAITLCLGCGSTENNRTKSRAEGNAERAATENYGGEASQGLPLPDYLFTVEQAREIVDLVSPKETTNGAGAPPQLQKYDVFKQIFEEFLNRGMSLPEHAPGRKFDIYVIDQPEPNALTLNEMIVVHRGLIENVSPLSMALVLCHEAAHSTKNHGYKYEKQVKAYDPKVASSKVEAESAVEEYLARYLDRKNLTYTHNTREYAEASKKWNEYWHDLAVFAKTQESEADIVGGKICANLGFASTDVLEGATDLFSGLFKDLGASTQFRDGSYKIEGLKIEQFVAALFAIDTHPTASERAQQFRRISEVFIKNIDQPMARDFVLAMEKANPSYKLNQSFGLRGPTNLPCHHRMPVAVDSLQEILGRLP